MAQRVLKFTGTAFAPLLNFSQYRLEQDISNALITAGWGVRAFNLMQSLPFYFTYEAYINADVNENAERVKNGIYPTIASFLNETTITYAGDDIYSTNIDQTVTVLPTYDKTNSSQAALANQANQETEQTIFGLSVGAITILGIGAILLLLTRK